MLFRSERQSFIEGRVLELEDKISRAEVIDVSKLSGDSVKFGATVKLADEDTDEEISYQIVGADESDIKAGRLSITAPLARSLIGKSVGDVVEVSTPNGSKSYEIIEILYICLRPQLRNPTTSGSFGSRSRSSPFPSGSRIALAADRHRRIIAPSRGAPVPGFPRRGRRPGLARHQIPQGR